ncbi:pyrophosphate--fructose 6-phosphate 1-phosphotransferase [Tepiditoga spiralis]|uniref:Pyrophosphate--fructose 6-phosphate 1-phosphotransferase n=1 Tax=Tepiditoga spiralis TaxID=2108365 RepID=A0A7G1G4U5_9BACT|nr:6-phosphofructokinase [Tepiditoga spiralis]BBE31411.1 pyrophosphate--fructose 6-phosphate 1-phosphotransferase [Tepiditoga spiralis]
MKNAIYAQSGGVTSVINASAYGVIKKSLDSNLINKVFVGINGINGVLNKEFIVIDSADKEINNLKYTPSAAFGSCRKKLTDEETIKKVFKIFEENNIGYFFYNGGNDSMDTANKINDYAIKTGYDLKVIGIPKTIDNDLIETDHTPGFGSAAKYLAISMLEGSLDVKSMCADSTKVFVMETMGRHAGWLAASTALANLNNNFGPHIILLPEVPFDENKILNKIENIINKHGYCSITVSEGIQDKNGKFLSDKGFTDAFGNKQLGNAGVLISDIIHNNMKLKVHTAIPDYLQRSGRHISSLSDVKEAINCGMMAVKYALDGESGYMVTINRVSNIPYYVEYGKVKLSKIANGTKYMPKDFISEDGLYITDKFIRYAKPLIEGEYYPIYENGIPIYSKFNI